MYFKNLKIEAQDAKEFILGHKTSKWQSQDTNSELPGSRVCALWQSTHGALQALE